MQHRFPLVLNERFHCIAIFRTSLPTHPVGRSCVFCQGTDVLQSHANQRVSKKENASPSDVGYDKCCVAGAPTCLEDLFLNSFYSSLMRDQRGSFGEGEFIHHRVSTIGLNWRLTDWRVSSMRADWQVADCHSNPGATLNNS